MPYLLDTSALLAHYRNERGADQVQALFEDEDEKILLCSVSLPEFSRRLRELGATETGIARVLEDYKQLVDEIVSVDESVAEDSDELLRFTLRRLPLMDALIGSAARSRQAVLVHRDAHMRAIPAKLVRQLDLEDPAGATRPL